MALNYRSKLFGGGPGGGSGVGTSLTTQVLFNSSGSVAGDAGLTYDSASDTLTVGGTVTAAGFSYATSQPFAVAIGAGVLRLGSTATMHWTNGNIDGGTPDAGMAHPAPGTIWFTDGGMGGARSTVGSRATALTDGSATPFASFAIADGADYAGEIMYKIRALKGTALQTLKGRVQFSATREGATYSVSVSEMGTQTLAAAAGTLTGAISIAGAAGVVTLSANFNTSQSSPDTFVINYRFDSPDAALAITPL